MMSCQYGGQLAINDEDAAILDPYVERYDRSCRSLSRTADQPSWHDGRSFYRSYPWHAPALSGP